MKWDRSRKRGEELSGRERDRPGEGGGPDADIGVVLTFTYRPSQKATGTIEVKLCLLNKEREGRGVKIRRGKDVIEKKGVISKRLLSMSERRPNSLIRKGGKNVRKRKGVEKGI